MPLKTYSLESRFLLLSILYYKGLVVQKSPEHLDMKRKVVQRGIVWDAQVFKSEAKSCQLPSSLDF
jgi:hypothetical protein